MIAKPHLAIFLFLSLVFTGCNKKCQPLANKQTVQSLTLGKFNAIELSFPATLNIVQGSAEAVQVQCDSALQGRISAKVYGNTLRFGFDDKNLCNKAPIVLNLTIKDIELITASGKVQLKTAGPVKAEKLTLDFAGNVNANLALIAQDVKAIIRGADTVNLAGQTGSCKLELNGNVIYGAPTFTVADYEIKTTGQNTADIAVINTLKLNSTGKNVVTYKGNPKTFKESKDGLLELREFR